PRREQSRDRGGDRDRSARIERETAEAARTEREPRRDRDRDAGRERRYRQEDLGPAVKGFGDAVPAFMLIPLPRPRAEKPAVADTTPETEAA
ncbi:DNA helicase, partial [Roseomonas soli]|nr:DNA helicase [Neoroseomonas soli]